MPVINLDFQSNAGVVINEVASLADTTDTLTTNTQEFNNTQKEVFKQGEKNGKALNDGLKKNAQAQGKLNKEEKKELGILEKLEQQEKELLAARKKATNPKLIESYNKGLTKVRGEMTKLTATTDQAQKKTSLLGGAFKQVGGFLLAGFGIGAVIGGIKDAFQTIQEFQQGVAELSSITGIVGDDLTGLGEEAIRLSLKFGTSATDIIKGMQLVKSAMAELDPEGIVKVTESADILSKATGVDLPTSVENLTQTMNQFGLSASDASETVDILATSQQKGTAIVSQLSEALKNVGSVANAAGISLSDTTVAIQGLAKGGILGAEAGTKLRGTILRLQKAGIGFVDGQFDLQAAIAETEEKFKSITDPIELAKEKSKLFGEENVSTIDTLIAQRDVMGTLTEEMGDLTSAEDQAITNTETLAGAQDKLGATYDAFILSIDSGEGVISNFFKSAIDGATDFLNVLLRVEEEGVTGLFQGLIETAPQFEKFANDIKAGNEAAIAGGEEAVRESRVRLNTMLSDAQAELQKALAEGEGLAAQAAIAQIGIIEEGLKELTVQRLSLERTVFESQKGTFEELTKEQEKANAERVKNAQQTANDIFKIEQQLATDLESLADKVADVQLETATGAERIEAERLAALELIDELERQIKERIALIQLEKELGAKALKELSEEEKAQRISDIADVVELEQEQVDQLEILRADANTDAIDKLREFTEEQIEATNAKADVDNQKALDEIQLQEDLAEARLDLFKDNFDTEVAFEEFKQEELLKIQVEAARKRLALLEGITTDEARLEAQQLTNLINDLEAQLDTIEEDKDKFSLAKLLGLSDEELAILGDGIKRLGEEILGGLQEVTQASIDANQALIDSLTARIEETEAALNTELQLNQQGFASNVQAKQEELAELKRQRAEAQAEQEKLQKRQIALDTITQVSGLITSSANIFKALSPLGPIGIGIAIATTAAMFTAFALTKVKALQAAEIPQFDKGGYTGDGPNKGKAGDVHYKEFVNDEDTTTKNRDLLEGLHRKDRMLIERGVNKLLRDTGITLDTNVPGNISAMDREIHMGEIEVKATLEGREMLEHMSDINYNTRELLGVTKNRPIVTERNGYRIERYPGKTKRIKLTE